MLDWIKLPFLQRNSSEPLARATQPRAGFGVALGGGGARGFAHIGVMRVLEREGLRPSLIAGTSMGALMGVLFAQGASADEVESTILSTSWVDLVDLMPGTGLLRFASFERLLETLVPARFEDLPMPFAVTATDLVEGKQVYFTRGDLHLALKCTIAYPGAVDPTWIGKQLLADGGILNQVPVDAARFLGASHVLAVDVTAPTRLGLRPPVEREDWWSHLLKREPKLGSIQAMFRAAEIMQAQISATRLSLFAPDVIIRPDLEGINLESFWKLKDAVKAGEQAAEQIKAELKECFGDLSTEKPPE
jgi:NTE family protein